MPKRPSKKQPARPPGFTQAQIDAGVAARDRSAAGNPRAVRGAFLGGQSIKLGALEIQPLTIGTFWLLEEIGSPLSKAGEGTPVSFRQLAEAAFVLTDPVRAHETFGEGKEAFARASFALACQIPIQDMQQLTSALFQRVSETQDVMPPPAAAAGANPSVPPAKIPVSAGG